MSTIKINTKGIKAAEHDILRALGLTALSLQRRVREAEVVPRRSGQLEDVKFFIDDSNIKNGVVSLVFEGPYARRLYYHPEYNFSHAENPNAQGLWMSLWEPGGIYGEEPQELFNEIIGQIMGGNL
jgi:hypothetical protein